MIYHDVAKISNICCLAAPSHYLKQCWPINSTFLCHSSDGTNIRRLNIPISKTMSKIAVFIITPRYPMGPINKLTPRGMMLLPWVRARVNDNISLYIHRISSNPFPDITYGVCVCYIMCLQYHVIHILEGSLFRIIDAQFATPCVTIQFPLPATKMQYPLTGHLIVLYNLTRFMNKDIHYSSIVHYISTIRMMIVTARTIF